MLVAYVKSWNIYRLGNKINVILTFQGDSGGPLHVQTNSGHSEIIGKNR